MINTMMLAVVVPLGPALALYFLLGRPVKWLLGLALASVGVVRSFWLSPHATDRMMFTGLCWFCFAGVVVLVRALRNQPGSRLEAQGDPGLNRAC